MRLSSSWVHADVYLFIYLFICCHLDEDVYEVQMLAAQFLSYAGMKALLDILLILTC